MGSGGREHAIALALRKSDRIENLYVAPGNGGTMACCQNLPVRAEDIGGICREARDRAIDLVVVGPEVPLALGVADELRDSGIAVFGPGREAARIEASKAWAKELMREAGVPTPAARVFAKTEAAAALAYLRDRGAPIVVKADGLAAGKGVTVARTLPEAETALHELLGGKLGEAGERVAIEDFLAGQEISVLAVVDGLTVVPLLPAQDHKPIGEGDAGPNTGGMGSYAPTPIADSALMAIARAEILEPIAKSLHRRGIDYRGILYAGLMVDPDGRPQVLEFNCRFGDPETQAILPLLETPLLDIAWACSQQKLAELPAIAWHPGFAACVVAASAGYPGSYAKGKEISGIEAAEALGTTVFHAGTRRQGDRLQTDGGRVLGVTARGKTLERAIALAYRGMEKIDFEGKYYRRDIGFRVL